MDEGCHGGLRVEKAFMRGGGGVPRAGQPAQHLQAAVHAVMVAQAAWIIQQWLLLQAQASSLP